MEIEGKIIFDLPLQEGIGKSSGKPWKKKEWVLETPGMYPRKVKFHVFGDRIDQLKFEMGRSYVCQCDVESREFNGKWYTEVNVYSARESGTQEQPAGQQSGFAAAPVVTPGNSAPVDDPFKGDDNNTDDLPF